MSLLETDEHKVPGLWSVSNVMAAGAVLISIGVWVEQARSTQSEIAKVKETLMLHDERVGLTYQRKDVAAEQYVRLMEQLARIERQLTQHMERR